MEIDHIICDNSWIIFNNNSPSNEFSISKDMVIDHLQPYWIYGFTCLYYNDTYKININDYN